MYLVYIRKYVDGCLKPFFGGREKKEWRAQNHTKKDMGMQRNEVLNPDEIMYTTSSNWRNA